MYSLLEDATDGCFSSGNRAISCFYLPELERGRCLPPHFSGLFGAIITIRSAKCPATETVNDTEKPRRKPIPLVRRQV